MSNLLDMYIKNNQPAQLNKETITMNPVNGVNSTPQVQQTKTENSATKAPIPQNNLSQDTFEKKDKTKKVIKYGAIGAGIAAIAYSAFALIKYGKTSSNPIEAIKEPVKVLLARINPNGFRPKADILQDEAEYMYEMASHARRLTKKQCKRYYQHVYDTSNFTQEAKECFEELYSKYINKK